VPVNPVLIHEGLLDDPRVVDLLIVHVTRARAETAPGSSHALDLSGLKMPEVRFFSAWDGDTLLGCSAVKSFLPGHGEIKSMHTAEAHRGRGVGDALLRHLIDAARGMGLTRLSLETGSWPYFAPAHRLYERHDFRDCPPFADYVEDPNSRFMSREI
jgi:putative acetyltransferase